MLRLCWLLANVLRTALRRLAGLPREAFVALGGAMCSRRVRAGRLLVAWLATLPPAFIAAWAFPQVTLVMSPSIDAWAVRNAPGQIRKGDYVEFILTHPIAGPKPVSVTKLALCMPGDRLTMLERRSSTVPGALDGIYFCDGTLLGISMAAGSHGQRLDHMHWAGIIPPGYAYVGSHHPRGFDSRYIGLVPIRQLTRMRRIL